MRPGLKHFLADYIWLAAALSLLFHAVLIYSAWSKGSSKSAFSSAPEIALINYKNDEPVLDALLLAQWQAAGGGTAEAGSAASAPFSGKSTPSPNDLVLQAMEERLRAKEQEQQNRLLQLEAEWQVLQAQEAHLEQPSEYAMQLAQELHVLKMQVSHYNAIPRVHFDAPSARSSPFAAYIEDWRAKIERLGTEHYPDEAKGQLSDALQLTVYIDKAGNLIEIEINQPAQNPIFTVAAQRIVRLAAPFGPFSAEMKTETDILAITRSWRFTKGALHTH